MPGADILQPVSFYVDKDFTIKYGKEQKEIKVPRMSHASGEKAVRLISEVMSKNVASVIELLGMEMEKKGLQADGKKYKAQSALIGTFISELVNERYYGIIQDMLEVISEGVITKKMLGEMQFTESAGVLCYLLDNNFHALKNLSASLDAITMSIQPPKE